MAKEHAEKLAGRNFIQSGTLKAMSPEEQIEFAKKVINSDTFVMGFIDPETKRMEFSHGGDAWYGLMIASSLHVIQRAALMRVAGCPDKEFSEMNPPGTTVYEFPDEDEQTAEFAKRAGKLN
jgi:hypothetical protein